MQVFLPYTSVRRSFQSLDSRRLNKQHLELHQLITCVDKKQRGESTSHHAAVNLFMPDRLAFAKYCFAQCVEVCLEQGIKIKAYRDDYERYRVIREDRVVHPIWFGRKAFHSAHRQALLAKSKARYIKACDDMYDEALNTNSGYGTKVQKEYAKAVTEYQWYRSMEWSEDPNTTVYHYYWWDYKNNRLYLGPDRDAMEE